MSFLVCLIVTAFSVSVLVWVLDMVGVVQNQEEGHGVVTPGC